MTSDQGFQLSVWLRWDGGPREVVVQVYDRDMHSVGEPRPVRTHGDVQAVMDEYGIPPGRWDREDAAVAVLDENSESGVAG
jgi:hypothetical protein